MTTSHHIFELEAGKSSALNLLPEKVRRITMTSSLPAKWELENTVAFTKLTTWIWEVLDESSRPRSLKVTNMDYDLPASFYICVEADS